MEVPMLCTRAQLHNFRQLLPLETAADRKARQAEEALQKLVNKNPSKASGRHVFFAELYEQCKKTLPPGQKVTLAFSRHIMEIHGDMY
eukprot:6520978-Lingulodinium_polyedra.AAC.1